MSGSVRAPEFPREFAWLNTDRPLRLAEELRGRIVVLDFWTYCCINCMHVLPDLAELEEKYENDPVQFIGVHSAKFSNEASRETIRAAILRYEIKHPVIIDENMQIWRSFSVRSWPTIVVIDSTGHVSSVSAGEGNKEIIDQAIEQALSQGRAAGTLAKGPLELRRDASVSAASGLAFPGKVFADGANNRLFVADSNHNRIVISELPDAQGRAKVVAVVGSGRTGREDGPPRRACFNHPQGLVCSHGKLYVADTENHLIRAIDLTTFHVTTIVGTGEMTNDRAGGLMGTAQGLNSPWDLALEGSTLYVAMAGVHQIWRIDLPVGFARAFAGTGRENIADGPTELAALAQPSGICLMGGRIYFADSEVSALRGIDMATEQVLTVVGEGLFSFGDVDGQHPKARLQHPLGVAAWGTSLLVADTYNHKIKRVDPAARTATTMFGTGRPGAASSDGGPAFFEPGGLSVWRDQLFVADTNNHRIVRIHLKTGSWNEIAFDRLNSTEDSFSSDIELSVSQAWIGGEKPVLRAAPVSVHDEGDLQLCVDVQLPAGCHLSPEAPWCIRVAANGDTIAQRTGRSATFPLSASVPIAGAGAEYIWQVKATFAYCTSDGGLCIPSEIIWELPIRKGGDLRVTTLSAAISR